VPAAAKALRSIIAGRVGGSDFQRISQVNLQRLTLLVFDECIGAIMRPAFEQALNDDEATAWVGDNDSTALAMLEFFTQRGIAVPQKLSVVGFDNYLESQLAGLRALTSILLQLSMRVSHISCLLPR
jgi:hypothetical protein